MARIFGNTPVQTMNTTMNGNQTYTVPPNVYKISVTGRGGSGTPGTPGGYGPAVNKSAYVTSVQYLSGSMPSYGTAGTLRWENVQNNGASNAGYLNSTGTVNYTVNDFAQYDNGYAEIDSGHQTSGKVIPGSAYTYTSDAWKTSGPVVPGDYAFMYLAWQEYGPYNPPTPATTGADTTGFGYTFPGGVGGVATQYTYNDIPVTPGQQFPCIIPSGGFITVSYQTY